MKLTTRRTFYADKVRAMCIRQDYYTCGTNTEYNDMLDFVNNEELDDELVLKVAQDIFDHSNTKKLMYQYGCNETELLESICYNLINDCCYTSVKIEK